MIRAASTQVLRIGLIASLVLLACARAEPPAEQVQDTAATAPFPSIAIADSTFGIVVPQDSTACLQTARQSPLSDSITVIFPGTQSHARAKVLDMDIACVGGDAASSHRYYRITSEGFAPGELGIAIVATAIEPPAGASTDIDGDGMRESYRACTSNEGVHLTVWTGDPVRRRVWHHYHYLGYDVDPNCGEADYSTQ